MSSSEEWQGAARKTARTAGRRASVVRMVAGLGLRLIAVGILVGMAGSYFGIRPIANQIWGIPKCDLSSRSASSAALVVGLAACYFPARRQRTSIRSLLCGSSRFPHGRIPGVIRNTGGSAGRG
jgi:hypothetical protein